MNRKVVLACTSFHIDRPTQSVRSLGISYVRWCLYAAFRLVFAVPLRKERFLALFSSTGLIPVNDVHDCSH